MSATFWEGLGNPRACVLAWVGTFAAAWCLARLAPRLGWVDPGDGDRKRQREPLPLVGGASLAVGLALAAAWSGLERIPQGLSEWPASLPSPWASSWSLAALSAAFCVGWIDDVLDRGLPPALKLVGQALCGAIAAGPLMAAGEWLPALLVVGAALLALNALNTFDNADGAAAGLSVLALAPALPVATAALLGFLPFNLRRADGRALLGPLPRAILGDSGSHFLGMLILLTPAAWPALTLPLLDLLRVALERVRSGQAPWIGDRRHLAHRLQARGWTPAAVALALAVVALPSAASWSLAERSKVLAAALGVALTAALFLALIVLAPPGKRAEDVESVELGLGA